MSALGQSETGRPNSRHGRFILNSGVASISHPLSNYPVVPMLMSSGRNVGLSMGVVQFLDQAQRVKIAIPKMLTRICIEIALVVSNRTK
jgi:hypothetical protein